MKRILKILVACEESQAVCKAFRALGHEAYSCDLQECSGGHPEWHLQMDALEAVRLKEWDLLIAHPPCTYLANSGLHYLRTIPERIRQLEDAFDFVKSLWGCEIPHIALENPTGWLNSNWRKPTQIIQPYYFGTKELKTTCLWLKNLPKLFWCSQDTLFCKRTSVDMPAPNKVLIRKTGRKSGETYNCYWREGKNANGRSKTFPCFASEMAKQWSEYILSLK